MTFYSQSFTYENFFAFIHNIVCRYKDESEWVQFDYSISPVVGCTMAYVSVNFGGKHWNYSNELGSGTTSDTCLQSRLCSEISRVTFCPDEENFPTMGPTSSSEPTSSPHPTYMYIQPISFPPDASNIPSLLDMYPEGGLVMFGKKKKGTKKAAKKVAKERVVPRILDAMIQVKVKEGKEREVRGILGILGI